LNGLIAAERAIAGARSPETPTSEVLSAHEGALVALRPKAAGRGLRHVGEAVASSWRRLETLSERKSAVTGLSTGLDKLDDMTAGLQPADLIIIAGRPSMGKSSVAMGIAQHAAVNLGATAAVFSLEMSAESLAMRMISSEGRIEGSRLRTGALEDEHWPRISRAAGVIAESRIFIDDTPSVTIEHIESECDRLIARGEALHLIVVDYLQLMEASDRKLPREQVIARNSRGLKALAKKYNVPVVALSQLSRALEQRQDKRPIMSDVRECIAAGELVPDVRTGAMVPMEQVRPGNVVSGLDGLNLAQRATVRDAWSTGIKPTVRVRTRTGRTLRCTRNHPLLSVTGWRAVETLLVGEKIALARALPAPSEPRNPFTADELRLMGSLVCDGSYIRHRSVSYVKCPEMVGIVSTLVAERFGVPAKDKPVRGSARQVDFRMDTAGPNKNPLIQWMKSIGMHGQKGAEKHLPWSVFESSNDRLGVLLGAVWAGDGTVNSRRLKFTNTSPVLIQQVSLMLTRLGIVHSISKPYRNQKSRHDLFDVLILARAEMQRFADLAPMPGPKGRRLLKELERPPKGRANFQLDRLPVEITNEVDARRRAAGVSHAQLGYRCQGKAISPDDLRRVATALGADDLVKLASPDILWDEIESIEDAGQAECFDLRARGCFAVSGFIAHNSGAIEQDADVMIFVYRDVVYNPETERPNVAELIIGKQRNGPLGTAEAAFLNEYTRFENLAPDDASAWKNRE
jgi:replicative DNA helicase